MNNYLQNIKPTKHTSPSRQQNVININDTSQVPDITRVPYQSTKSTSPGAEPFLLQFQKIQPLSPFNSPTRYRNDEQYSSLSPTKKLTRPVLSPILKTFATVFPTVTMEAKDLKKWLTTSALNPAIQDMSLRPLLPEEVEENLNELHEAYSSAAKEIFRNIKLLSSPLGSLMENIWDSYVES